MTSAKEKFLRYVKVDTRSEMTSETTPTTQKQFDLARMLEKELRDLGLQDISLDEKCYLMASLPANTDRKLPVIGFIAHVDTSPEMSDTNVSPRIIPEYDGGDILLNKEMNLHMAPDDFPELAKYTGQELIVTDGTTLLGADDKAGIAIIMTMLERLSGDPTIKHGTIKVAFTPDEEVGRGADHFDVKKFGADFAYTVDGGEIGELEYESFNAAYAIVTIQGKSVHPGSAKNKMINSIHVGQEFDAMLPANERPEYTEGYEGFYHLMIQQGETEKTTLHYIVRDHDRAIFEKRKSFMQKCADFLNKRYGEGTVEVKLDDQYYNMREQLEPVFHIVELAKTAIEEVGIKPIIQPIRGGTDGSRLSYMGLPCPNIFTGGLFAHGRYECLPTRSLEKCVDVVLKIIELSQSEK